MPYVYLIGWSKLNKFYYGARWSSTCDPSDLWTTYFTSSKHVAKFRKEHGEPDIIQVRKTFESRNMCQEYEMKVLRRLKVLTNDKWLNKNINGRFLPFGPQSKEHIEKRIKKGIATKVANGTMYKPGWTKETHPLTAQKMSELHKGIPKSDAHIEKMKERPQNDLHVVCPHCQKTGEFKNMQRWHFDRCKQNPLRDTSCDPVPVSCPCCKHTSTTTPNFFKNHGPNCKN